MSLMYRGHEVQAVKVTVDTVDAGAKGTYRGASVAFRRAVHPTHRSGLTKHYRGVTY